MGVRGDSVVADLKAAGKTGPVVGVDVTQQVVQLGVTLVQVLPRLLLRAALTPAAAVAGRSTDIRDKRNSGQFEK